MKPKPKTESERNKTFAKGGTTPMLGKGNKVTVAPSDSANPQKPGTTAHKTSGPKQRYAKGGPKTRYDPVGGLAFPAAPGSTGPRKG